MLGGKSGPLCAAGFPCTPPPRKSSGLHHSGAICPRPRSRVAQRVPSEGRAGAGAGTAHRWKQKGPGNPTKPPERVPAGRPERSRLPSARRLQGCGPSRSAQREPRREAGGCGAGPGPPRAAGAREEREAPPRCGRRPSGPRPGFWGAVPGRAHSSSATRPSPGVPAGARPAAKPGHPGPPPTSRASSALEEEEEEEAVAAPARGCAERGRRRSARWGGRGRVCAPGRRPRASRLASGAQPLSLLRHRHTPTKHPPPCDLAGHRAAGRRSEP